MVRHFRHLFPEEMDVLEAAFLYDEVRFATRTLAQLDGEVIHCK